MQNKIDLHRLRSAAGLLRIISHPERVAIIECLSDRRSSVGELVERIGIGQVAVSKHLMILKRADIVRSETRGRFRYYSLAMPCMVKVVSCIRDREKKKK